MSFPPVELMSSRPAAGQARGMLVPSGCQNLCQSMFSGREAAVMNSTAPHGVRFMQLPQHHTVGIMPVLSEKPPSLKVKTNMVGNGSAM